MAGVYNVYLKNLVPEDNMAWGEGDMYAVGLYIKQLFDEVCQNSKSTYTTSDYWWDPPKGSVKDTELLVYVLFDSSQSLIHKKYPKRKMNLQNGGNTFFLGTSTPRISEIYLNTMLKFNDAHLLIAKLAFHELMHNKLEPFSVHTNGGGGLATDGTIYSSTPLNDANKELMAKNLGKRVPQYQGAL
jgi:hypothetical protein